MIIPNNDDPRMMRRVRVQAQLTDEPDHTLYLWDTNETDMYGKSRLGYAFWRAEPTGEPLFSGEDYYPALRAPVDSDAVLLTLLVFLTSETEEPITFAQRGWLKSNSCQALYDAVTLAEEEERETGHAMDMFAELGEEDFPREETRHHMRWLQKHGACEAGLEHAGKYETLQEAWDACARLNHLAWVAMVAAEVAEFGHEIDGSTFLTQDDQERLSDTREPIEDAREYAEGYGMGERCNVFRGEVKCPDISKQEA